MPEQSFQPQRPKFEKSDAVSNPQSRAISGRNLGQILISLVVLLVLVNIPMNYYGFGLAHLKPDSPSVIIQNGMLLKGSGPEIYLLEDHKLRWISSPELFARYFSRRDVKLVDDSLLEHFESGQPIRHLVTCQDRSYIYALEDGQKRWVKDPPPTNRAKPWDRIHAVPCDYLYSLPTGWPVTEDPGASALHRIAETD